MTPAELAGDRLRIVVPRYGSGVVGGAENAMRRLAHALSARGWAVEVWTTTAVDEATWSEGYPAGDERDGAVAVRRFPVVHGRRPRLFRQLSRLVFHLRAPRRLEMLWAVAQGPHAPALVTALTRADPVPTLFSPYLFHPTVRGLPAAPHPRILCPAAHDEPPLRVGVVRDAILAADALWFHSPEERELVVAVHPQAASKPAECGVVGVDAPDGVDATAFAARHGLRGPYLYFGGRTAGGKGLALLIDGAAEARRRLPSLTLVLSGDAGAAAQGGGVVSVGMLDERERWEAIAGAAAVIVPGSLESLSLLALEAWALGRPCLVNAASAVLRGHIERGGGGWAFESAHELGELAVRLVDDPAAAAAMGAAGRSYVRSTYRWDLAEARLRTLLAATGR
jgi:glycosyltransferase involved in cell wall biosynthesis